MARENRTLPNRRRVHVLARPEVGRGVADSNACRDLSKCHRATELTPWRRLGGLGSPYQLVAVEPPPLRVCKTASRSPDFGSEGCGHAIQA
jgi:hypothetical protein